MVNDPTYILIEILDNIISVKLHLSKSNHGFIGFSYDFIDEIHVIDKK